MQEGSLHASLKEWYSLPGDLLEATVEGYSVDIVRGGLLIEIQTRNFSALKRKLKALVENHRVRLVYPIPMEKWIARVSDGGELIGRRRSPRRGSLEGVFYELVSFPQLVRNPGFSLEVLMIREEEVRRMTSNRWRKAWSTVDRRLLEVVESAAFESPSDYRKFLPRSIRAPFTSRDLADALRLPCNLAQKMAYCLRGMGVIEAVGRRGNFLLYATSVSR
ncbi:MAG: hypothetical protein JTT11_01610 [Candidatus Brockarchaeota archaeon]|nr:hypothetical protein [Candidatus Brockarchaeota archaeon]